MDYVRANKAAWEEAFEAHQAGYRSDPVDRLRQGDLFLEPELVTALREIDVTGKAVAQFCCNNGRELLSVMRMGAEHGTGFDIAENFAEEGRRIAREAELAADFVATDILAVDDAYANRFDVMIITCGALTWFADLDPFFEKVALVLRDGAALVIHEKHPFTDMVALPREDGFEPDCPERVAYSYFREEPWIESGGADYIGGTSYESKPFTSFGHTFGSIINAMTRNGLTVESLHEYDRDICSAWEHLEGRGIPLSYLMVARSGQRM
jgi:SAM-dependent methyltransferase